MDQKTIAPLTSWNYLEDRIQGKDIVDAVLFQNGDLSLILPCIAQCPIISIDDGAALITPQQHNENIFLLLSGNLTIHLENSESLPIRTVCPGEIVGELSLISSVQTTAYVLALGTPRILVINKPLLWHLIDTIPPIAQNLLHALCDCIISSNQRVVSDRHRMEELKEVADKDGLTGLFNRRSFDESLPRMLAFCVRKQYPLSLLFMDVDNFKKYNDTQGHPAGDQVLTAIASALLDTVRPGDLVARYGGEEFVAILPGATVEKGLAVAERLRIAVAQKTIATPAGKPLPSVTISLGIAEFTPDSTPSSLLSQADKKLYEAKQTGRNRCCF